jgi:hypothetical protein
LQKVPEGKTKMKPQDEIQRAHDTFAAIVLGDVPNPFGPEPETAKLCIATLDALCWCLGHDEGAHGIGGQGLKTNLRDAEAWLTDQGYVLMGPEKPEKN